MTFTFVGITKQEIIDRIIKKMIDFKKPVDAIFEVIHPEEERIICDSDKYFALDFAGVFLNDIIKTYFKKSKNIKKTANLYIELKHYIDGLNVTWPEANDFETLDEYFEAIRNVPSTPWVSEEAALEKVAEIIGLSKDELEKQITLWRNNLIKNARILYVRNKQSAFYYLLREGNMSMKDARELVETFK